MNFRRFNPLASLEGSKLLGISSLLFAICLFTAVSSNRFLLVGNLENIVHRTALFGILSIGAAFVIITGGIDLSIGSVVCLTGVLLPYLLTECHWSVPMASLAVLGIASAIGVFHGFMITKMRLQPFVVTLCGLLLYRGIARGITGDQSQGFGVAYKGLRVLATGHLTFFEGQAYEFRLPATTLILIAIAVIASVVLNRTVFGRYLFAVGGNPEAAKYSGVNVDRVTSLAYLICSILAGLGGVLFVLDINAAQPSDFGNFYELYAIAAAVLGGCSLRGGEGNILGVVLGAAVMVVLSNAINLVFPEYQNIEFAIIGGVILAGVTADVVLRRLLASRN
ncbi:ABC transporter permease [Bythopirellula goksoeyrii]|uniref:Xylose transport system permease protein XylH n=1 Tax=Bythopirellula goksoeyrii TaxID=1400387 RepID=A0A5B9Q4Z5_9BACT|nr:ABC transporter permease [Bythopirellula goksoeyrii]QEG32749.1 Xylose transport system permease protein XylH [Bythopirellula goksoeyrii]